MIRERENFAVLGAGFAGSLMAMVLRQIGYDLVLIERDAHPRFAIGESATPLANLSLESLAKTYDLPRLRPLTEYGFWRRAYPDLTCGRKRGFSFFSHQPGEQFSSSPDHDRELLVGATPDDESADMHWLRSEFDAFLAAEASSLGIAYFDHTSIDRIERNSGAWLLRGERLGEPLDIRADFLIDATGPGGTLAKQLSIPADVGSLRTNSRAVYSHFTGVEEWQTILGRAGIKTADHPYPCDAAALHHIVPGAWMWLLRFDNGITSAGFAFDQREVRGIGDPNATAVSQWKLMCNRYPSIAEQFANATPTRPLIATPRLQRRSAKAVGPGWAMLPHAAYFLDPLLSPGIAHTLFGIERLAAIFQDRLPETALNDRLAHYETTLFDEIDFLDQLLSGSYRCFGQPRLLHAWLMYYFAAAIDCETRRRAERVGEAKGFLSGDNSSMRAKVLAALESLVSMTSGREPGIDEIAAFEQRVLTDIAPMNHAGLLDPTRRNMYAAPRAAVETGVGFP